MRGGAIRSDPTVKRQSVPGTKTQLAKARCYLLLKCTYCYLNAHIATCYLNAHIATCHLNAHCYFHTVARKRHHL